MTLLLIIVAFVLGILAGSAMLRRIRSQPRHIDYKKRWEEAIGLLDGEGRLTQEQVDRLRGKPAKAAVAPRGISQQELYKMGSYDRMLIEVARAQKGLNPFDDLCGMGSTDRRKVLEARAAAELRRVKGE